MRAEPNAPPRAPEPEWATREQNATSFVNGAGAGPPKIGEAPHAGALRGFSLHPKVEVGAYPADKFKMRANGGTGAPGSAGEARTKLG